MTHRIRVDGAPSVTRGYDVVVRTGSLDDAPSLVIAAAPAAVYAVITPDNLADTYGARVVDALRDAGERAELVTFADGESHKTRSTWASLTDRMIELGLGRDACVVAVGGGVTGDVAGFVAATYMRGIPIVQVPTTLLAMVDASVGAKTGVDTDAGKNLVGAFHPPAIVIIDPAVLRTLPEAELRAGLAEAVKHGAIMDAGYFEWIDRHIDALLALDSAALEHLIARSIEIKAGIVSEDPYERGRRAILNFGHTVAHAIEHVTAYGVAHGHAVSIGMCVEAVLGESMGVTGAGTSDAIARLLDRCGLPVRTDADADDVLRAMRVDKKARRAQPRIVLLEAVGACLPGNDGGWTHEASDTGLRDALVRLTAL